MNKIKYELDRMTQDEVQALATKFEAGNEYICETAGFVPLDVKFKQFEQNGMVAQFMTSDFTSSDYRDMFLNPDFDITPEDDLEDVMEKRQALAAHIESIKADIAKRKAAQTVKPDEKVETETKKETEKKD